MSTRPTNDDVAIVIPTIGRPSLRNLLNGLANDSGALPRDIVLVDDRRRPTTPLDVDLPAPLHELVRVVRGRTAGPAAARNDGWRSVSAKWIVFLDDDVVPPAGWLTQLAADLRAAHAEGAVASAGRVVVPLPRDRAPTDWERNTAALQHARWATADLAYRKDVLVEVAGFDERFPRAYREDADLALRVRRAGYSLAAGRRQVLHPVRPAGRWVSLRTQKGNADDALMRALHGPAWRTAAHVFAGRRNRHLAVTALGAAALGLTAAHQRRAAAVAAVGWLAGTVNFARERVVPGPRTAREVTTMAVTSALIPPLAVGWWLRGLWRWRDARPWPDRPTAVLLDRDGTLIHDVPYNGDPDLVMPTEGAREALDVLRSRGVRLGVVSNQSGVASGRITTDDVAAVNARIDEILGPIGVFQVCPHAAAEGCNCRKPAPALVTAAAEALGANPKHCVVIGDIGSDVDAAANAGARGILVPNRNTRPAEVTSARHVAADLRKAVRLALDPDFFAERR